MGVDYKKFYRRCKEKYPFVVDHLAPDNALAEPDRLPAVFNSFLSITGHQRQDIIENKNESRLLFIAVAVLLSDPRFFEFSDYAPYRLLYSIGQMLGCGKHQILYNLRKVKNYWEVYPAFRSKVEQLYTQINYA